MPASCEALPPEISVKLMIYWGIRFGLAKVDDSLLP